MKVSLFHVASLVALVALFAAPASGLTSLIIGTLRCVGGPAQWCRDVESARACGAEQYCKDKVWKTEAQVAHNVRKNDAGEVIFSSFNDESFDTMEKMMEMQMKEMEGMMKAFMGPQEGNVFDQVFDSIPRFFPKPTFDKSEVNDDKDRINNINNIIIGDNNIIGYNDNNEIEFTKQKDEDEAQNDDEKPDESTTERASAREDDDVCGACVNITTEIRDVVLTKANEEAAIAALEGVCKKLGPVEGVCDEAVKSYVPKYFEMAKNFLNNPKMLCKFAGLCQTSDHSFKNAFPNFPIMANAPSDYQVSAEGCSLCSNVAQGLKSLLRLPGFAENLPSAACALVDEEDEECMDLMSSFVEVFHEQLDPAIVCASSFCSNSGVDLILEEAEDRLHEEEEEEETKPKTTEAPTTEAPTTAPPTPPPKPLPKVCRRCIFHTRRSIRFMKRKLWRDRRRWLWGCKFALNKTKCVEAVDAFIDKAVQKLNHICPKKVCAKLGFCPPTNCTSSFMPHDHEEVESFSSKTEASINSVPMLKLENIAHSIGDDNLKNDVCTYCEEVVNYVKILVGNPDTREEVIELLLGECKLTGLMQGICEKFVKEELVALMEQLAHVDTKQTCVVMHLCSASGGYQSLLSSVATSMACGTCKSFIKKGLMPLMSSAGSERDLSIGLCHTLGRNNLMCHNHLSNFLTIVKARFAMAANEEEATEAVCQPFCRSGLAADWDECLASTPDAEDAVNMPQATEAPTTEAPTTEAPTTEASTTEAPTTEAPTTPEPAPQPPACKRCIKALTLIKDGLTEKVSCVQRRLRRACILLLPLKDECQAAVKAFFAPLLAKIANVQPEEVCVKVGVCIPSEAEINGALLPPMPLIPRLDLGVAGGRSRQLADVFGGIGPVMPANGDVFPDLGFLDEKKPEAEERTAKKADDDAKIRVGGGKTSSASSIRRAGAASSSSNRLTMNSAADRGVSADAVCTVCTYLVDELKENLSSGTTKEDLKAVLMAGCVMLPVKQRDECIAFMVPILNKSVDFLGKISTKEICQVAKACPLAGSFSLSSKMEFSSVRCFGCKFAVEEVKSVWSNPNVPATINGTLHSLCLKLPVDYQPQCHEAIDQTFPVIDGMMKEMDPEAICEDLGACETRSKHLLGADDCHWHLPPKVFCAEWQRAIRCHGVDFCKKTVWGN